ncbi:MAG: HEAT repeat domain-containing protein [Geovibrio sp.]|nr:HEAT repeat domain-containing protein [Geovibrio sp.]
MDIQSIKASLLNEDETERLYAVEDVITLRADELIPELIAALRKEESRMVKELIVEGLKLLDVSPHFASVAKFFESTDAFIRNCAIEIFGSKGEDAVPYLTSVMDHSDKEVRKLILDSLVATGSKYCIPALRAALRDKAPNVQITAVEYLGKINDEESLSDILEIFETSNEPMLRISCIETFTHLAKRSVVDTVLDILGGMNMDSFYKPSVFRMVAECGSKEHLPFLLGFLNNRNTLFFNEISGSILKIMIRDNVDVLPYEYEKYVINGVKNQNLDSDNRITFMGIAYRLCIKDKEEIFEEFAGEDDMNVMLAALDKLAGLDREKTLKIIERRLKVAEGDSKEELLSLRALIAEQ